MNISRLLLTAGILCMLMGTLAAQTGNQADNKYQIYLESRKFNQLSAEGVVTPGGDDDWPLLEAFFEPAAFISGGKMIHGMNLLGSAIFPSTALAAAVAGDAR